MHNLRGKIIPWFMGLCCEQGSEIYDHKKGFTGWGLLLRMDSM